jgi:hypothetical protein
LTVLGLLNIKKSLWSTVRVGYVTCGCLPCVTYCAMASVRICRCEGRYDADYKTLVVTYTKGLRGFGGLVIGAMVGLGIFFLAIMSGAYMKPAGFLAPALLS